MGVWGKNFEQGERVANWVLGVGADRTEGVERMEDGRRESEGGGKKKKRRGAKLKDKRVVHYKEERGTQGLNGR